LKQDLAKHLSELGHEVLDCGTDSEAPVDYPIYGAAVGRAVVAGRAERGVCVCGTGIGIGIAANKVPGIRAAVAHDVSSARLARQHNDANVICFGERLIGRQTALDALDDFLAQDFLGGRHQRRISEISELDGSSEAGVSDQRSVPDSAMVQLLAAEMERQSTTLQLIASENFTSRAVLTATASVLTNKYSEGYPGRRYYGGNTVVDQVEDLARERAKSLFGAEHANVQPHSGASANLAVYLGLLQPGDTILAMPLDKGGHLTHGAPVSITGKLYKVATYGLTPERSDGSGERIDLDQVRDAALRERPRLIIVGTSAYARVIEPEPFRAIADEVDALLMFDIAHPAGLVAGGAHPNPVGIADVVTFTTHKTLRGPRGGAILCRKDLAKAIDSAVFPGLQGGPLEHVIAAKAVAFAEASSPDFRIYASKVISNAKALAGALEGHGFRLVSGGTDTHQVLVDLRTFDSELTGKVAQDALDRAGITVNRNQIPDDPRPPFVSSGLRLGTPAETTAGMGEAEMVLIADLIARVLEAPEDGEVREAVLGEVHELTAAFPPYGRTLGHGRTLGSGAASDAGSAMIPAAAPVGS